MMLEKVESEMLILRRVQMSDLDAVGEYRAEFLQNGDSMDGCCNLRKFDAMDEWYAWICRLASAETCPPGWAPDTQFVSVRSDTGRMVGMLDIRYTLSGEELKYGNIGYSVRASERRKGYATEQLRLAKAVCRSMGKEEIQITCNQENTASAKVILRNGGVLENEAIDERNGKIIQRYRIDLT